MLKVEDDAIKAIEYIKENKCSGLVCRKNCPLDLNVPNEKRLCEAIVDLYIKVVNLKDVHIRG